MKICPVCHLPISGMRWQCSGCRWEAEFVDGFPSFAPAVARESNGFDSGAHERLFCLEDRSFWFRSRNKLLQFVLDRYFPDAADMLEVGCGTGYVMSALSKARPSMRFVGAEIYTNALKLAQSRAPRSEFIQMDASRIPFEDAFDVVGAFDVLEHVEADEAVLKEIYKAVKPGGGIVLTVPQHRWLWSRWDEAGCHKRRYSRTELAEKLTASGFRIKWMTSFVTLLLPVLLLSRLRWSPGSGPDDDVYAAFGIPARTDAFLEAVCDVERRFLKTGRSLPVGGSLLSVCMKG